MKYTPKYYLNGRFWPVKEQESFFTAFLGALAVFISGYLFYLIAYCLT